jgi:hypothetical protein
VQNCRPKITKKKRALRMRAAEDDIHYITCSESTVLWRGHTMATCLLAIVSLSRDHNEHANSQPRRDCLCDDDNGESSHSSTTMNGSKADSSVVIARRPFFRSAVKERQANRRQGTQTQPKVCASGLVNESHQFLARESHDRKCVRKG